MNAKIVKIKNEISQEDIEFHPYGRKLDRTNKYSVLKEDKDDYVFEGIQPIDCPTYFPKEWFEEVHC